MELYNKEFVYFDWDDKLEGKKGFFADNITDLKENVTRNRKYYFGEICKNPNYGTRYPFAFIDESGCTEFYRFCYYDPCYEFRKAYIEGKQLQFKNDNGNWEDVDGEPAFTTDEYRIKDECKGCMKYDYCCDSNGVRCKSYRTKAEYVPFDTVDELIKCWEKKFPGNANRPEYTMPLIWIKSKEKNRVYLITEFWFDANKDWDVGTSFENLDLEDLFEYFTFLDGSIIGKRSK